MSYAPPNWVFSLFSFIGFVLCCIPFPWHLAGNQPTYATSLLPANFFPSLEHRDMSLYGLDWRDLLSSLHQLRRLER